MLLVGHLSSVVCTKCAGGQRANTHGRGVGRPPPQLLRTACRKTQNFGMLSLFTEASEAPQLDCTSLVGRIDARKFDDPKWCYNGATIYENVGNKCVRKEEDFQTPFFLEC